jgi:hypothetical protein
MNRFSRQIKYTRYEHTVAVAGGEDTVHTGSLLTFVYDLPIGACGIFPPLHLANKIFSRGTAGGGMSPGTDWEPFTVSLDEYAELVEAIQSTPLSEIRPHARYASLPFKFDHSFDDIVELIDWQQAVCEKHREQYHAAQKGWDAV